LESQHDQDGMKKLYPLGQDTVAGWQAAKRGRKKEMELICSSDEKGETMFPRGCSPTLARGLLGAAVLFLAATFVPADDKKDPPPVKEKTEQARPARRENAIVSPEIHADYRVTFRL